MQRPDQNNIESAAGLEAYIRSLFTARAEKEKQLKLERSQTPAFRVKL